MWGDTHQEFVPDSIKKTYAKLLIECVFKTDPKINFTNKRTYFSRFSMEELEDCYHSEEKSSCISKEEDFNWHFDRGGVWLPSPSKIYENPPRKEHAMDLEHRKKSEHNLCRNSKGGRTWFSDQATRTSSSPEDGRTFHEMAHWVMVLPKGVLGARKLELASLRP